MLTKKFSLKNIAHICPIVYNVYMCNPELERQPKSNLEDRAKEVLGYIETIDFLDATLDLDKTPICRGILYKSYARKVLDRLPENVGTYIHAQNYLGQLVQEEKVTLGIANRRPLG